MTAFKDWRKREQRIIKDRYVVIKVDLLKIRPFLKKKLFGRRKRKVLSAAKPPDHKFRRRK